MDKIYFEHFHLPVLLTLPRSVFPVSNPTATSRPPLFHNSRSPICAARVLKGVGPCVGGNMGHISGTTPSKKTDSLSSRSQRVSLAPHPGVGLMGPCTLGSRSSVAGMWRGVQWCSSSVLTRRLVQLFLPTPGLWNSPTLFSVMLPNPLRKKGYFDQMWIFPLTKIHCTEKLPWWGLRAVLIYGDGDVDLEDCWVLYSLIKITVESSVLRLMSFLTIVGQIYSSGHGYCRVGLSTLNSVQEVLVTPIIFMSLLHTLAYLVGRVIMAVHTPHSWVGLLMPFPPSSITAPPGTVNTSQGKASWSLPTQLDLFLFCDQNMWYPRQ